MNTPPAHDDLIVVAGAGGFIALIATPVNLGSRELVSIDGLVSKVERIAGATLDRQYDPSAPRGVAGRNSNNTFIREVLDWEPSTSLDAGLTATYGWIQEQYRARQRDAVRPGRNLRVDAGEESA